MQRDIADYRIGLRGCNLYLLRVAKAQQERLPGLDRLL